MSSAISDTIVCIPTYNERGNIERIVKAIFKAVPEITVVIADDNSPDGTGEVVKSLQSEYQRLHLLHRTSERGFASSYKDAFCFALSHGFQNILQMDADFSHSPDAISSLIEALPRADFVVGSRYAVGGKIENWPLKRKILSRGGNLYASLFLGSIVSDMTGGFNLWKRSVLEKVPFKSINCDGYSFLIELKFRAKQYGFKGVEVPITFTDRTEAVSKMSPQIMREAVLKVPSLLFSPRLTPLDACMTSTTEIFSPVVDSLSTANKR